ncbi:MAG: CDGSH iron-sulfur domain-containing protein [Chloroflexi bacterium]|nr:CDGSH iron-sulfur domain-containing protein [Chloroflexota bacterium]
MADATVVPTDNGPYVISGSFTLKDAEGNEISVEGDACLCRCGTPANKPFCDGSHRKASFKSSVRA